MAFSMPFRATVSATVFFSTVALAAVLHLAEATLAILLAFAVIALLAVSLIHTNPSSVCARTLKLAPPNGAER
jgi:hypothetical protein